MEQQGGAALGGGEASNAVRGLTTLSDRLAVVDCEGHDPSWSAVASALSRVCVMRSACLAGIYTNSESERGREMNSVDQNSITLNCGKRDGVNQAAMTAAR
ncbi:hypothetical protein E2C01_032257 [Portunus trituberculatus]|uniref:Uncharacterized protein n=1 Tax=Portunus trituberculatus TaxID=210409 RepID=A0A5B7F2B4_PORTR|nr:hypothetical protein [Portunus trituberculatus]